MAPRSAARPAAATGILRLVATPLSALSRRLIGAALTGLTLVSAGGFSLADALLYHTAGAPRAAELRHRGPHFEGQGRSGAHADRCILGWAAPGPRAVAASAAPPPQAAPPIPERTLRRARAPVPSERPSTCQPRGPPGLA